MYEKGGKTSKESVVEACETLGRICEVIEETVEREHGKIVKDEE